MWHPRCIWRPLGPLERHQNVGGVGLRESPRDDRSNSWLAPACGCISARASCPTRHVRRAFCLLVAGSVNCGGSQRSYVVRASQRIGPGHRAARRPGARAQTDSTSSPSSAKSPRPGPTPRLSPAELTHEALGRLSGRACREPKRDVRARHGYQRDPARRRRLGAQPEVAEWTDHDGRPWGRTSVPSRSA